MGARADRVYARAQPLLDPGKASILPDLIAGLTGPGELLEGFVRDDATHVAWGAVLDPDATPAELLPWLALFPGVQLPVGIAEAEQRSRIGQAAGFYSGTDRAIIQEVQRTLTGGQSVALIKGGVWAVTVRTRTTETPDPAATAAAALAQKPAGVILTMLVSDSPVWDEATLNWDSATGTWDAAVPGHV